MRRITVAALVAAATVCLPAIGITRLQAAKEVAIWRWGDVCGGHVTIFNRPLRNYIALATWNRPHRDCTVTYTTRRHWQWWDLCRATVHEYGHLALGLGDSAHSENPNSVMYPWTLEPWRPCGPDHNHPRFGL